MKELYRALNEVLERKIELYDRLIHIFGEEWKAITEYSRERLLEVMEQKEVVLVQVGEVNQKREAILRKMSAQWNIPADRITLKKIAEFKNNPWSMSMILHQQRIKGQIEKIKRLNALNRKLIQRSAASMKESMNVLYKTESNYTPYQPDGKVRDVPLTRGLINTNI